jgi:hypothetical protein
MFAAHAHSFDASRYPPVEREVPGLGMYRVDGLFMDQAMRLFAVDRPLNLDYRQWASDFIAATMVEPRLSRDEVEELSELARETLRAAAAEANECGEAYRALAGSHLSRDECLLAAYYTSMREQFASLATAGSQIAARVTDSLVRAASPVVRPLVLASVDGVTRTTATVAQVASRSLTRSLAGRPRLWVLPPTPISNRPVGITVGTLARRRLDEVGRLIGAHRRQLRGGLVLYESLWALSRYAERSERLWEISQRLEAWTDGPLAYITEPLRPGVELEVIGLVETAGEAALLDLLERVVRDEQVMAQLRATVGALPVSESKRVRLDHALGHVAAGEYPLAIDAHPRLASVARSEGDCSQASPRDADPRCRE